MPRIIRNASTKNRKPGEKNNRRNSENERFRATRTITAHIATTAEINMTITPTGRRSNNPKKYITKISEKTTIAVNCSNRYLNKVLINAQMEKIVTKKTIAAIIKNIPSSKRVKYCA